MPGQNIGVQMTGISIAAMELQLSEFACLRFKENTFLKLEEPLSVCPNEAYETVSQPISSGKPLNYTSSITACIK